MKKSIILILVAIIGLGISANGQAYSKALEKQANGGDSRAMVAVGDAYLHGNGTGKDLKKAEKWYKKAIDKDDNLVAYERMADLYRSWDGIEKKPSEVKKWAEKGANKGNPRLAMEVAEGYYSNDENYQWYSSKSKDGFIFHLLDLAADSGYVDAAKKTLDISLVKGNYNLWQANKALDKLKKLAGDQNPEYIEYDTKFKDIQSFIGNLPYERISDLSFMMENGIPDPSTDYFFAVQLAQKGDISSAKFLAENMLVTGGYWPNNLSRVYLVYLTMGESEAMRFLDKLLAEDPAIIERWLTDKDAVRYLKTHKDYSAKDPELTNMLPPNLTTAQINTILNMARR